MAISQDTKHIDMSPEEIEEKRILDEMLKLSETSLINWTRSDKVTELHNKRSKAFASLSDPTMTAKNLVYSKVCRNIVPDESSKGEFKVCTREHCTFAHGEDEWAPARCSFGNDCRFYWGGMSRDGKYRQICKFYHSGHETVDQWTTRTGQSKPNLPLISKRSQNKESEDLVCSKDINCFYKSTPTPPNSPSSCIQTPTPPNSPSSCIRTPTPPNFPSSYKKTQCKIINVLTKELAEIAINVALDQGLLNIKIIID